MSNVRPCYKLTPASDTPKRPRNLAVLALVTVADLTLLVAGTHRHSDSCVRCGQLADIGRTGG